MQAPSELLQVQPPLTSQAPGVVHSQADPPQTPSALHVSVWVVLSPSSQDEPTEAGLAWYVQAPEVWSQDHPVVN